MQDLQYWREYVRAGFRIILMMPMEPNKTGGMACTCNKGSACRAIGKHPRSRGWQTDRRDSEQSLDFKGGKKGFAYYGVSLENLLVVDVDPRNGGWNGLEALESDLDMTLGDEALFVVETGGGGVHYYFRNPEGVRLRTAMKQYPGIDFKRNVGHYVMGAGSLHASGGTYNVISGSPATVGPAPDALLELIKSPEWDSYSSNIGEADFELVEDALFAIPNDDVTYDEWLVIGLSLAHWDNPQNWELFDRWSQQSTKYDENETDRKWRSFGTTGARTIGTIFGIAADNGWIRPQGPVYGTIDLESGELFQEPEIRDVATRLATLFKTVSFAHLEEGVQRRDGVRREEMAARTVRHERAEPPEYPVENIVIEPPRVFPPEPNPVTEPARMGTGWRVLGPQKKVAEHDGFVEPEDMMEFGDAPEVVLKVRQLQEAEKAAAARVAPSGTTPPKPTKERQAATPLGIYDSAPLPGLAGRIVDHIEKTAWAFQRPAAEANALQALSCAAWGATGFAGAPLSLITLVIAETASGKDHPQKVFIRLMEQLGRQILPETRSDKDFMYALEEQEGKLCLVIDEAHAFFGAMENERAPAYMVNMAALLLKASTSNTLHLARNHLNDISERMMVKARAHQKQIDKVSERKGVWEIKTQMECEAEIRKCEAMIERLERRMEDLKTGIKGIHFNLAASSTPVKFNKFINAETVGSGLTGRSLLFDCGLGAPPQRRDVPPEELTEFFELAAILREISEQAMMGIEVKARQDALDVFDEVFDTYIGNDENYNHAEMGALHRRIRERVYSVSSVLAVGNNWIITADIVRAALRLCQNHLSAARSLLVQNNGEDSEKEAKVAITEIVLKVLKRHTSAESYMNRSTFRQRLEKNNTAKKLNTQWTNPKIKGRTFLERRIIELRNSGILAFNGSDDDFTRLWLTEKGVELAKR
jgi:hypothetical protein